MDMHKILFKELEIAEVVENLAIETMQMMHTKNMVKPTFLCILDGAFRFYSDLVKIIHRPILCDFIKASSYEGTQKTEMKIHKFPKYPITKRDIIIIDDILDTGDTLKYIINELKHYNPKSISAVTLLKRKNSPEIEGLDWYRYGFELDNEWVAGYGMDDLEDTSRNLNYIFNCQ